MAQINLQELKDKVEALEALEALRVQVNETEISVVGYQDNDMLLAVLDDEYPKLFSPATSIN